MKTTHTEQSIAYETLDKDYGRSLMVGPGYGQLNLEQYKMLEELVS